MNREYIISPDYGAEGVHPQVSAVKSGYVHVCQLLENFTKYGCFNFIISRELMQGAVRCFSAKSFFNLNEKSVDFIDT